MKLTPEQRDDVADDAGMAHILPCNAAWRHRSCDLTYGSVSS